MADYLFNTILLYNKPDPIGSISFFIFIILVILIVQFFKGISERKEEKKNKETERIYNEKIAFQENTRRQLGLELPRTYPNTFPVLIFVQQRQLIYANYCNDSKSNKGKSEYQFYYVLCRFFEKQNIFWNTREIGFKRPDFVYEDKINKVFIAIEIDEPYILKTGRPLHYFGNKDDIEKEKIYNERGWILIRFSESQVINQPKECCKFIAKVIDYCLIDFKYFNMTHFENCEELKIIKLWDYNEALQMAKNKSRQL